LPVTLVEWYSGNEEKSTLSALRLVLPDLELPWLPPTNLAEWYSGIVDKSTFALRLALPNLGFSERKTIIISDCVRQLEILVFRS
jgi:hypothetical protein